MNKKTKYGVGVLAAVLLAWAPATSGTAMEGPETVQIDALAQYYDAVTFDHTMHVEAAEDNCAVCHHHTTGTPTDDPNCVRCHNTSQEGDLVACQDCHAKNRFEADYLQQIENNPRLYHRSKVGLKGAYHLRCMGCHQEVGAPTGCEDCHSRNDAGDKLFHAGTYAPAPGSESEGHH